jgi:hypothetical protein
MAAITIKELLEQNTPHREYSKSLGENAIAKIDKIRFSKVIYQLLRLETISKLQCRTMQLFSELNNLSKKVARKLLKLLACMIKLLYQIELVYFNIVSCMQY